MKNSNDNIGNRTRDLPACSAVPQFHRQGRGTNRGYSSDTLVTHTTVHGVKRHKNRTAKIFDLCTDVLLNFTKIMELQFIQ